MGEGKGRGRQGWERGKGGKEREIGSRKKNANNVDHVDKGGTQVN